jgi:PTS system N-acetylgalactosamine-specific IIB component
VILLLRVDNRLIHGQILEAWVPRLHATRLVVADDEAAASAFARAAMGLCLPPHLPVEVRAIADVDFAALAASKERVLVLFRDIAGVARAVRGGLTPALAPRLNVGNVHYGAGRRAVTPSVFLTSGEVAELAGLAQAGFEVEARAIPADAATSARAMAEKYDAAGEKR